MINERMYRDGKGKTPETRLVRNKKYKINWGAIVLNLECIYL